MSGRKNHGNNAKRFDVNAFYANLRKAKVLELLDKDGNTPYDSDAIDNSVWEYAAYLYNDINNLGILSYFDSDSFRHDSDGSGENGFGDPITRTAAVTKVYNPLRRFLYSVDNQDGIDDSDDVITSGFRRKYYTLPMSDSEGTLRHVNIYTILKAHFNRWLKYDPYERRYIAKRVFDVLNADSDMRYDFARMTVVAFEEDSDLMRRVVEQVSNVLQSDSEIRNEMVLTTITAFQNDSDAARSLIDIIHNVYQTDSDRRVTLINHVMTGFENDSDSARRFEQIISNVYQNDSDTITNLVTLINRVYQHDSDKISQIVTLINRVYQNDSDKISNLVTLINRVYQNDSDKAIHLTQTIVNVLESDSDSANKLTEVILNQIENDSDYQTIFSTILNSTPITQLIPGSSTTNTFLGDSDHHFHFGFINNLVVDSELRITDGTVVVDSDSTLKIEGDIEIDNVKLKHAMLFSIKNVSGDPVMQGYLLSPQDSEIII